MQTSVAPKQKRTVTFEVTREEAWDITGYLSDSLKATFETEYPTTPVREIMRAFSRIGDDE